MIQINYYQFDQNQIILTYLVDNNLCNNIDYFVTFSTDINNKYIKRYYFKNESQERIIKLLLL